jgi:putative spermidine/putrescine transport system substrate-binding protein
MEGAGRGISRRGVLKTGAGLLVAAVRGAAAVSGPLILTAERARAAGRVILATQGALGDHGYGDAVAEAFTKPFTKETGIEVQLTGAADMAKLKAQVMTGSVEWDVLDILPTEVATASHEGLLEPVDYGIVEIDESDLVYPQAKQQYATAMFTYTGGIAYDKLRHPDGKHPTNWPEFWDVKRFPGRRGLRARPNDTLELASLAAGIAPKDVYPIDVDRAFASLDAIKPFINKWIDTTPQTVQLIETNELDFTNTFGGRVFNANKAGIPLGYPTDQLMIAFNTFAVPKGAKNRVEAMKLMSFMCRPDRQAAFCELFTYPPVNKKGIALLSPAMRQWVPDMSNPKHLVINAEWWGEPGRFAALTTRFRTWLLT